MKRIVLILKFLFWGMEAAILDTEEPKEHKIEKDSGHLKTA